ncbi:MAG: C40 family peptidase [Alphaproteobacteria bacterium]|nr:C40 family peptidase [Alphaproteobacteria bacterium]
MWCNDYINIPFQEHGRNRAGCDCWGLARIIYKEKLDIDLPTLLNYENTRDSNAIVELYEKEHLNWVEIPVGEEKEFDILVFKILGLPTHIGIVINKGMMIHCEYKIGTHITEYYNEVQWRNRLAGVYRYAKH